MKKCNFSTLVVEVVDYVYSKWTAHLNLHTGPLFGAILVGLFVAVGVWGSVTVWLTSSLDSVISYVLFKLTTIYLFRVIQTNQT